MQSLIEHSEVTELHHKWKNPPAKWRGEVVLLFAAARAFAMCFAVAKAGVTSTVFTFAQWIGAGAFVHVAVSFRVKIITMRAAAVRRAKFEMDDLNVLLLVHMLQRKTKWRKILHDFPSFELAAQNCFQVV